MPKHPPKGYFDQEYPLYHEFTYKFSMNLTDPVQDATICTLIRTSEVKVVTPEAIEVHPENAAFAENNGPLNHLGSIVPTMSISINAFLSEASIAIIGADRPIKFNWMPLYTGFINSLTAEDTLSALQIEDILELKHDITNKDVTPLFVSDLDNAVGHSADHPITTEPSGITDEVFGDYNLGVDLIMESVAFDKSIYFDLMKYGTNRAMLRKVAPHMNTAMVSARRPYSYYSNNFTYPSVKRINPYTFCGILFSLPQAGAIEQPVLDSEVTDVEHLFLTLRCRYPEWNPNFDQSAR